MSKIVAFTGRAGSGKSVAARVAEDHYYEREKFAGALKAMTRTLLAYRGVDSKTIERMIEGDLKEVPTLALSGRTPRHAMQTLGTEWGRMCMGEDFWVDGLDSRLAQHCNGVKIVIDDMRYENEYTRIKMRGATTVRIIRPDHETTPEDHTSEQGVFPVDITIVNDGSLEELEAKLREILK